ncbi:MAG: hypothetical protein WB973_05470, partial [Thermoanaerobaculia bacterium]
MAIERKIAIEVIHFSGHTPLYIETEPFVRNAQAKDAMLSLLSDADGFVSIHYLSEGRSDINELGEHTPIEFELIEFCRLHPNAPVLLFRRKSPDQYVKPSERMLNWFDDMAARLNSPIISVANPNELQVAMGSALQPYGHSTDDANVLQRVTIRYLGPDFIGLIGKMAEVIFTKFKLNIDDISHTAAGEHATICVSCTPRQLVSTPESINTRRLQADLLAEIEQAFLAEMGDSSGVQELLSVSSPQVFVDLNPSPARQQQFYLEIRAIDAPGQINAVCKQLYGLR